MTQQLTVKQVTRMFEAIDTARMDREWREFEREQKARVEANRQSAIGYRIGWMLRKQGKSYAKCLTDSQRQGYRDSRKLTALRRMMAEVGG